MEYSLFASVAVFINFIIRYNDIFSDCACSRAVLDTILAPIHYAPGSCLADNDDCSDSTRR